VKPLLLNRLFRVLHHFALDHLTIAGFKLFRSGYDGGSHLLLPGLNQIASLAA